MTLKELSEKMYAAFIRNGYPGIAGIGETDASWIFVPARENPNEKEYGLHPYVVDKKTIAIRIFDVLDPNDWDMLKTAKKIDVPKDMKPLYQ